MEHKMGLYETPFNSMKSGRKTVEVRLYDDKRRKLNIGDTIKFTKLPDSHETLGVEVVKLRQYPTFKEMYESIAASDFDAVGDTVAKMVNQTYKIYTPEKEKEWGTVAITIRLLD
ncbi:ASCH domain-containing protein [Bacillus sp. SD088]|uniref:ASCH domain-containing protein n=1 Tax=Bacillus sp. SD088 TaxID=2782012 RepID=UPI001A975086|nr:ASCH domain-containing protein [Bacillus sp. SD088]MBO0992895.1 ASCH domain-containing protein [Bacillus sp. SD088]